MMNAEHATPELFAAIAAAQAEIENATKNAANPHYRSRYADLAEVLNTVRAGYAKQGVCILQSPSFDGQMVYVETVLAHKSGGWVSSSVSCVPAKTDAQGIGACTTYLRRYGLAAMTAVAQEDDDGESVAHDKPAPVSEAEAAKVSDFVAEIMQADAARLDDLAREIAASGISPVGKAKLRGTFTARKQQLQVSA